jgi:CotH kinase protein/Lamin Tail Domain/EF hand
MSRVLSGISVLGLLAASLVFLPFLLVVAQPPGGPRPGGEGGGFFDGPPPGFGPPLAKLMSAIDQNGDGEVSAEEIESSVASLKKLDGNGDGQLRGDEIDAGTPFGFPGFGPPGGRGGPGGPGGPGSQPERKLLAEFDKDGDGILNREERSAARVAATRDGGGRGPGGPGGPRGRGGPGGPGGGPREPAKPGARFTPEQVKVYSDANFYDTSVLRTLFLEFENEDWEAELEAFKETDVEVPAKLLVDGKSYSNVGISFRGSSSYFSIPAGYKRSFNVSIDLVDKEQRLYGYKTLNLLNANGDPSLMSSVLYAELGNQYLPTPKANFVRVVVNGESWGVYVNVQQFNKDFLQEHFETTEGTRWKVDGRPGADSGLRYTGDDVEEYRRRYSIRSKDNDQAWQDLIRLCRTLDQTPPDQLEAALAPMLDIDNVLWFLALDCALVNSDGYWVRASDYSIYLDKDRKFHLFPHDMNEAFRNGGPGGGPGGGPRGPGGPGGLFGGPGGGPGGRPGDFGRPEGPEGRDGPEGPVRSRDLDPLVAMDDPTKPLRSKLLAVPNLKKKYLEFVRTIAEKDLQWSKLGSLITNSRALLEKDVEADTRKLSSFEDFLATMSDLAPDPTVQGRRSSLRSFLEQRSDFLLKHEAIAAVKSAPSTSKPSEASSSVPNTGTTQPPKVLMGLSTSQRAAVESVPASIRINELMASNGKSVRDPDGDFDDWVELYNASDRPVDLSGMYLSDTDRAPRKWSFPKGTKIEAGGYLILWADEDGKSKKGIHLNFKLSSKGESLFLVDRDDRANTLLDHVEFSDSREDVSFGRAPTAPAKWQALVPTAGQPNRDHE